MVDEREGEVPPLDLPRAFNRQSLGRRAAVVAAGPLTNLLVAVLLFAAVGLLGTQGMRPFLEAPLPGTSAALAGVRAGDRVLSVDGQTVLDWVDLHTLVATHAASGTELALLVEDLQGVQRTLSLPSARAFDAADGDPSATLGLKLWNPPMPPRIGQLSPGGAAQRQGLLVGDEVQTVDGKPVPDWQSFVERVRAAPGRALELSVLRAGAAHTLTITPDAEGRIGRIGAGLDPELQKRFVVEVRRAPWPALQEGVHRTWDLTRMTLTMMGRMLTGGVSTKGIGGPLQIAAVAGESVRLGLVPFLAFLGLISTGLGVMNLLPIPVLDGGHLLYYSFELISGRPLPDRLIAAGTRVGIVLLVGLMALAFYNDINRFFSG
jgi:regulator of sigma E protease